MTSIRREWQDKDTTQVGQGFHRRLGQFDGRRRRGVAIGWTVWVIAFEKRN
jgi:hypothetical protein